MRREGVRCEVWGVRVLGVTYVPVVKHSNSTVSPATVGAVGEVGGATNWSGTTMSLVKPDPAGTE